MAIIYNFVRFSKEKEWILKYSILHQAQKPVQEF
jgi:hypothetical protein